MENLHDVLRVVFHNRPVKIEAFEIHDGTGLQQHLHALGLDSHVRRISVDCSRRGQSVT